MNSQDWELLLIGLAVGIPIEILILYALTRPIPQTTTIPEPTKRYSNSEEWEILRDKVTGRTIRVKVKRDAKET